MSRRLVSTKVKKDIKYVNRDFAEQRNQLIEFTKTYFPETYNDFNESSPGMMFMEQVAVVGDLLSFYTDVQLRESILETAQENINIYNIAHSLGYRPTFRTPASVDLDIFQLVPARNVGEDLVPDYRYALQVESGMLVESETKRTFRTLENVDFSHSSSLNPTTVTVYSVDDSGEVEYFLLKKSTKAVSGQITTAEFTFNEPKIYDKIALPETDVLQVISIKDSDNNTWYETPYLAQDLVAIEVPNLPYNDAVLSQYRTTVPYLLQFRQVERRFVTRLRDDQRIEIQFGSGVSSEVDEEIVPNPFNVGFGLDYFERAVDLSIDPKNFLYTRTYGLAPNNTTLTVTYTTGGGVQDNVGANTISNITNINVTTPLGNLDQTTYNTAIESIAVNNPNPARGGLYRKNLESVRREAISNFATQNRVVTRDDYVVRAYSMPPKYGAIAKAHVELDTQVIQQNIDERTVNPYAINLYVLGYDENKNFTQINEAVKYNLVNYFKQYRMITDAVYIKDAYIVNIGVDFEIVADEVYNNNEVLLRCVKAVQDYFDNDKMEIGKPIFRNTLLKEIAQVEGVITVTNLQIFNIANESEGYSGNSYNIDTATKNNIIYPSLDPCVFEIKYPNKDIRGRVVNY